MTDPLTPPPGQDDLTADDHLVEQTSNGPQDDDPTDQPSQDPDDLPAGTVVDGHIAQPAPATEAVEPVTDDIERLS